MRTKRFLSLLEKDTRNALNAFGPALFLGVPLLLVIQFTKSEGYPWVSGYWLTFFFSTTSLFFRSFGYENRFHTFHTYTVLSVPRLSLFVSQALVHMITINLLGLCYLLLSLLFWSPVSPDWQSVLLLSSLSALALSPLGTLLGLMLQLEREFLFSVIYLPLATPVILSGYSLSLEGWSIGSGWAQVLVGFILGGGFLSALIFEFFFDELSHS